MVDHSTTLVKAYSSALIYYLVPLELELGNHTTTIIFTKIKAAKMDLTAGEQRI